MQKYECESHLRRRERGFFTGGGLIVWILVQDGIALMAE